MLVASTVGCESAFEVGGQVPSLPHLAVQSVLVISVLLDPFSFPNKEDQNFIPVSWNGDRLPHAPSHWWLAQGAQNEAKPLGLHIRPQTKVEVVGGSLDEAVVCYAPCENIVTLESFTYLGGAAQNNGGPCQNDLRRMDWPTMSRPRPAHE